MTLRIRRVRTLSIVVLLCALLTDPARAQSRLLSGAVSGGVPSGQASSEVLHLSLADAVSRGLAHNLAIILQEQETRVASAGRLQAMSALLPKASFNMRESVQIFNTAAFGFGGFGGLPNLIGPFSLFDARVSTSAPIVDVAGFKTFSAAQSTADAARADSRQIREIVVLAVGNLYLEAIADQARTVSTSAQVATAEALVVLSTDQHAAGVAAKIDVLRQQAQLESARTQAIQAENQLAKRKLELARAIGLPAGQVFDLTDTAPFTPAPPITIDAALTEALAHREDLKAARSRAAAAGSTAGAASAARLPSLHVDGDIGAIGPAPSSAEKTYTVAASVHIPIFDLGQTKARTVEADAMRRQREAELADLEAGVRYELTAALLDVKAAEAGVGAATSARTFAAETLTQAEDRFRAGVASTVELVQAQEAVARASEQYITSVYAHNIAKAQFARALGEGESRLLSLIGGAR
jgi:outer membrane protein TolC